jgi:4-amino-4-deoxy-L-arabinose transferase-like glycosyltransferase
MLAALFEKPRSLLVPIAVLTALRIVAGAILPLSADEAYYWLWSKHLAAGYYDHPPAIAYLIRAGTFLFGDTSIGVRFAPLLLSFVTSWFVWRSGTILLQDERAGGIACLLFNLTLMAAVETMAATPDAPLIACAAGLLFALAKLDETQDGRWWLAIGVAGGLSLLSKYTGFFLGIGAVAWLLTDPRARRWLLSPWSYAGALLAVALFSPNLWWNAVHQWMTFAFQFGRIGAGHLTWRFLAEFLGAQLVLASPFIGVCMIAGLATARSSGVPSLIVAFVLPSIIYFVVHSLHDRVQGNWPCFLYPALAVAAAAAMRRNSWAGSWAQPVKWSQFLAIPAAIILLSAGYAQALFAPIPLGRADPFARLLGVGFEDVARQIDRDRMTTGAVAIVTTDYAMTAWLAYFTKRPVIQINEDNRWLAAPRATAQMLRGPLLYVVEQARDRRSVVATHFGTLSPLPPITRSHDGVTIATYLTYRVGGYRGAPVGRVPEDAP